MKSSLTLVPSSDTAIQDSDAALPVGDKATSDEVESKPHLRLVGPENQADFIKDAIATRQKRKPRKRKADSEDAASSKPAAKKPPQKKTKQPAVRKPRAKKIVAATLESTNVLQVEACVSEDQRLAIADLVGALSQVAEQKAEALIEFLISDLGEEAPVALPEAFEGPADPRLVTEFSEAVDAVLQSLTDTPAENEAQSIVDECVIEAAKAEQLPLRVLGQMIVSLDNDPFELAEWTLFEEDFKSRWYESKAEAMEALQAMMVEAGLNFACETKLISRFFNLHDYVYKRYSISAVVGVYANYTECSDQDKCRSQDAKIDSVIVPEAQIAFDKAQALHLSERKMQMKPESKLYDNCLKWFSVACCVALAMGLLHEALKTGFFS